MRGPVTFAFLPSSTTCRTTMSQHSSGSQRKAITEDERLLTQLPRERRAFTRTDSWRGLPPLGEVVGRVDTPSGVYKPRTNFRPAPPPPAGPHNEKAGGGARTAPGEG